MVLVMHINERERSSHPQAKLIPPGIWDNFFVVRAGTRDGFLSGECIALMELDVASTMQAIKILKDDEPENVIQYIYCIAITHPEIDLITLCNSFLRPDEAFGVAAALGRLHTLEALTKRLPPEKIAALIRNNAYYPFRMAALHEKPDVMNKLLELVSETEKKTMVLTKDYEVFLNACREGRIDALNQLAETLTVTDFIKFLNHQTFQSAAEKGQLAVFDWLLDRSIALCGATSVIGMIQADNFELFKIAARAGQRAIVERIFSFFDAHSPSGGESLTNDLVTILKLNSYELLQLLLEYRQCEVFLLLFNRLSPSDKITMLKSEGYTALFKAARAGNLEVFEQLFALLSSGEKVLLMNGVHGSALLMDCATSGNVTLFDRVLFEMRNHNSTTPAVFKERELSQAITNASSFENIAMVERLLAFEWEVIPASAPALSGTTQTSGTATESVAAAAISTIMGIAAVPSPSATGPKPLILAAFVAALRAGHMAIVDNLKARISPDLLMEELKAGDNIILDQIIQFGNIEALDWLLQWVGEDRAQMIASYSARLFRAILSARYAIGYGADEPRENGKTYLTLKRLLSEGTEVFSEAVEHCKTAGSSDEVSSLVALALRAAVRDELLKLKQEKFEAQRADPDAIFDLTDPGRIKKCLLMIKHFIILNKIEDMRFLLRIPSIRASAHLPLTIRGLAHDLLDLARRHLNVDAQELLLTIPNVSDAAIVKGYRSSTSLSSRLKISLTTAELDRWLPAVMLYGDEMDSRGETLFAEMIEALRSRYEGNPAKIVKENGESVILPLTWEAFNALPLTESDRATALKAYYQHPTHSAIRYLSIPNPWMDSRGTWSTFQQYIPLILIGWLAAKDESSLVAGYPINSRIEHFIQQLALIGRAYNRENRSDDDLEGDKPSCFSKARESLLQSIVGHALLPPLTDELVKEELRGFLKNIFHSRITLENCLELRKHLDDLVTGKEVDHEPLRVLNCTEDERISFLSYMAEKYGKQFTEEARFTTMIEVLLSAEQIHACTCLGLINLAELTPFESTGLASSPHGLFASAYSISAHAASAGAGAGAASTLSPAYGLRRGFY
jgi:hypothetical protein